MAKKYIEADALITCMKENCDTWKNDDMRRGFRECARIVFDMPAADVVEVVRCKDCENYRPFRPVFSDDKSHHFCRAHDRYMFVDDYCSYGVRKDG